MKKIILIFVFLLFFGICQAQNVQVSDIEYKNYINRDLISENNIKSLVNTALTGIELKNGEFIVLSGNLSPNNKLVNYKIKSLNISNEKANLIINKLNECKLSYNFVPDVYNPNIIYDQFYLYIGAKPPYEKNKDFIVFINLTNDKLKQDYKIYKEKMDEYNAGLYYKIYPEFIKIKSEYGIPIDKILKIRLSIDKKGNLVNYEIISSINPMIDNYMLSAIQKLSPFDKLPSWYDFSLYKFNFSAGDSDVIPERFKKNVTNVSLASNYNAIVKIVLNKRGYVTSAQIAKSSNNNLIDEEILNTIKRVNFIEYVDYDKEQQEFYLNIISNYIKFVNKWKLDIYPPQEISEQKDQSPVDWQGYMLQFQKQVQKNWKPPESDKSYDVVTLIILNKDGQIVSRSIASSSGTKEADEAVLKSIDNGVPYPKFPQGAKENVVPINFTFNYKVPQFKQFEPKYFWERD